MFGFMPPASQEHMMRACVLSRGIVAEIVSQDPEKYTSTAARVKQDGDSEAIEKLNTPLVWVPVMRRFVSKYHLDGSQATPVVETRRPAPSGRNGFKLPEKRAALYDDEVVDDVESLRKKCKLEEGEKANEGTADSDSSSDSRDSYEEAPNTISLSLSSSEDESDDDSD
ncbi:hypothetical protein F441_04464 [Phytophthora nicotianae CJ01A1]|uniref:Uncharacterized protein n=1 Tax=Phytophthora nicotianae CJ01A1 TaxID=1317063 RepID=W2XIE3_PHYNI|nr:hypothetical protein F441_04464 [Phytophthora nicotianae CJ01A1]